MKFESYRTNDLRLGKNVLTFSPHQHPMGMLHCCYCWKMWTFDYLPIDDLFIVHVHGVWKLQKKSHFKKLRAFFYGKKFIKKNATKQSILEFFWKNCGQKVLPDRSIRQKLIENVNIGKWEIFTMFGNHSKCRIWIFPPIFVLLKVTCICLVTLFDHKLNFFQKLAKLTIFGIFKELLYTQN